MKHIVLFIIILFSFSKLNSQNSNDCNITPNKAEFSDLIKFDENKNVKSLNTFIETKRNERAELQSSENAINKNSNDRYNYNNDDSRKNIETDYDKFKRLKGSLSKINTPKGEVKITPEQHKDIELLKEILHNNIDLLEIKNKNEENKNKTARNKALNEAMNKLKYGPSKKEDSLEVYTIESTLIRDFFEKLHTVNASDFNNCEQIRKNNLININLDIKNAETLLNELSTKELIEFRFKSHIMVIVGSLIAIILVCFFTGVLYKATDAVKQKLIGETGLQFITIFVIIIAVILFGVMNILKGSELAAILSAIAGYILGKTAPPKSDKTLEIELEILRLKSQEAERLKQEEEKKVAEAAEAIEKQEEEKRKLEIETENKKLEAEEIQDDINPDTTNESVKEYVDQVNEILSEDTDVNTIEKSDEFDESDESYEGIDEKK